MLKVLQFAFKHRNTVLLIASAVIAEVRKRKANQLKVGDRVMFINENRPMLCNQAGNILAIVEGLTEKLYTVEFDHMHFGIVGKITKDEIVKSELL